MNISQLYTRLRLGSYFSPNIFLFHFRQYRVCDIKLYVFLCSYLIDIQNQFPVGRPEVLVARVNFNSHPNGTDCSVEQNCICYRGDWKNENTSPAASSRGGKAKFGTATRAGHNAHSVSSLTVKSHHGRHSATSLGVPLGAPSPSESRLF